MTNETDKIYDTKDSIKDFIGIGFVWFYLIMMMLISLCCVVVQFLYEHISIKIV